MNTHINGQTYQQWLHALSLFTFGRWRQMALQWSDKVPLERWWREGMTPQQAFDEMVVVALEHIGDAFV